MNFAGESEADPDLGCPAPERTERDALSSSWDAGAEEQRAPAAPAARVLTRIVPSACGQSRSVGWS